MIFIPGILMNLQICSRARAGLLVSLLAFLTPSLATEPTIAPVDPSLQHWVLPEVPFPADNEPTSARVALGKMLFFDPRLSADGNMSCATCHNPLFGWSDGLPTARGFRGLALPRATPTVVNTAFNGLQMWDGRKKNLEDHATGPMEAKVEMNTDFAQLFKWLRAHPEYRSAFEQAYPGEPITKATVAKAIASFERTIISDASPFESWIRGDADALTAQQVRGFELFLSSDKGDCAVCHSAPNFTDDGFHNIGLSSWGGESPDIGRYAEKPIGLLKGAFKTPTLRDVALTAPYFHDGSAATLMDVVDHYVAGGVVQTNLSPNLGKADLTKTEKEDLVVFLEALTSEREQFVLPRLPGPRSIMVDTPPPVGDGSVAITE